MAGKYTGDSFHVGEDAHGGTVITLSTAATVASAGAAAAGELLPGAAGDASLAVHEAAGLPDAGALGRWAAGPRRVV